MTVVAGPFHGLWEAPTIHKGICFVAEVGIDGLLGTVLPTEGCVFLDLATLALTESDKEDNEALPLTFPDVTLIRKSKLLTKTNMLKQ